VLSLAKAEVLQTDRPGFMRGNTLDFSQQDIQASAPLGVARKLLSLDLPYGPYTCRYTANGQHLLTGGRKGHVAFLQCERVHSHCELHLGEQIRAVQPLHNENMFAVAQKKYGHIYDGEGKEIHVMRQPFHPYFMEFLPYHYILVSATDTGEMHYRDISTGDKVGLRKYAKPTEVTCMRQNPRNAVIHTGDNRGFVHLWTPNVRGAVAELRCQIAKVTSLVVHGDNLITGGNEGTWKIFDLRKYQQVKEFKTEGGAVTDLDVSMTGLVAVTHGSRVDVWKDAFGRWGEGAAKYMSEEYRNRAVRSVRFRPYEDILTVGHTQGIDNLIVPGAGWANYDSYEANPFESKKQRREKEVRTLLEKLQPDSIVVNPDEIGGVNRELVEKEMEEVKRLKAEKEADRLKNKKPKKKMRGKGKIGKRVRNKNVKEGKDQRNSLKSRLSKEERGGRGGGGEESDAESDDDSDADEAEAGGAQGRKPQGGAGQAVAGALGRFYGKRRKKT